MKKLIISLVLFLLTVNLFSQEIKTSLTKEDYLHKSNIQRKSANIFLLGGAACVVIGLVFPRGDFEGGTFFYGDSYKNDGIKAVFVLTGVVAMLVSIPFYLSASKNKRKAQAITLLFKNENITLPKQNALLSKTQSALNVKIML